ncbi:tRNAHis guanylyltransferase catalytic domain-containing protein [Rozella allomycis CSF55]|uniref:tRNA(His) guanylyltransferase n=1 Tax=Rozella allomycis (strain CSF55) TaxID=988480 RepID=A0A075AW17_ROZAC|nr:tRNAHis guanylyltransferase catalytic domain-containing protein [Rozella allomycis CSF55]|eukprot:EPZ34347.1 tRNAHis guanylyltransferase catalytic domain-containing protein [Rozella allomycis CSF55]
MRLDGSNFKNFTKRCKKPFDERITYSLLNTGKDLLAETNACTAFVQSDEISLIFKGVDPFYGVQTKYGGRISKLASTTASFAAARFNYYLNLYNWEDKNIHMTQGFGNFDCRLFNVPSNKELIDVVMWRHQYECRRNTIAMMALSEYGKKSIHEVSTITLLDRLIGTYGSFENLLQRFHPIHFYGAFIKKEQFKIQGYNPKTNEEFDDVIRTRVAHRCFDLTPEFPNAEDFLTKKYWDETDLTNLQPPSEYERPNISTFESRSRRRANHYE